MGISFSCNGNEYDDVFNPDLGAILMRSISFRTDEIETMFRSFSFNGRESDRIGLKPFGSGRMIFEGSVSFHERHLNPLRLENMIPLRTPPAPETFSYSSKEDEIPALPLISVNPPKTTSNQSDPALDSPKHEAAVKLQKVYKSFRTRRRLADCAVLVEQRWWKLLDFAVLKRSSVSFFDIGRAESAVSRWSRARTRVAKVGKGLSKDEKARKLAFQHWLEAIDPRHRYGHNLQFYYDSWLRCDSTQPFFYWLDVGEGRDFNHEKCSRTKLHQQCVKYLGPKEREAYEVIVEDGKFRYKQSQQLLDTSQGTEDTKWIFVLSTSKTLYVGQKKKGTFQHSSFLAGGATSAAGRLEVENGVLKAVWPYSGHYRPTEENFQEFISFLREQNVDLTNVKRSPTDDDETSWTSVCRSNSIKRDPNDMDINQGAADAQIDKSDLEVQSASDSSHAPRKLKVSIRIPERMDLIERLQNEAILQQTDEGIEVSSPEDYMSPKWNLFKEDQEGEVEVVPKESILRRINSKKEMHSYQLGKQLSCKWTTGAGPRIGCVRDYPAELQYRTLEQMSLSPRSYQQSTAFSTRTTVAEYSSTWCRACPLNNSSTNSCRTLSSPKAFFSPRNMPSPSPLGTPNHYTQLC